MTNYDIDVRTVEPTYNHTLARDTGRELNDGHEVHLTKLSIEVRVKPPRSGDEDGSTNFTVTFGVDHETERLTYRTIGHTFERDTSFNVARLLTALSAARNTAAAFTADVGLAYEVPDPSGSDVDPTVVHTALEVVDA